MASSQWFTLPSISPMFKYSPSFAGTTPENGWAYGANSGQSYYYTSAPNAEVQLSFYGSAIQIHGQSTCSSQLFADGNSSPLASNSGTGSGDPILQTDKLALGIQHNLTLQVKCPNTSSTFNFDHALIDGWLGQSRLLPTSRIVDDQDTSLFIYQGNWTSGTNLDSGAYNNDSQHYSSNKGDTLKITFSDQAFAIYGSLQPDHGTHTVQLSDGPFTQVQTYNTTTAKRIYSALLFFAGGFERGKSRTVTLTNLGPGYLDIDSVTFFNSSGSASTNTPPVAHTPKVKLAVIIGAVVGVFIFLVVIILPIITFCVFQRRKKKRAAGLQADMPHSELRLLGGIDDSPLATPLNFLDPATSHLQPTPFILPGTPQSSQYLDLPSHHQSTPSRSATPPPDYTLSSQDTPQLSPQLPQAAHLASASPKRSTFVSTLSSNGALQNSTITGTTGPSSSRQSQDRDQDHDHDRDQDPSTPTPSTTTTTAAEDYLASLRRRGEKPDPNFMYPTL